MLSLTEERRMSDQLRKPTEWLSVLVAGGLLFAGSMTAQANDSDLETLRSELRAMQEKMRVLQRRVDEAQTTAAAAEWKATEAASASSGSDDDGPDLKVKWKGAPEFSSKDGKFKMKVRGRLQADYNAIDQNRGITGRPDVSAAELRRARLGVEGVLWEDVKYKFEVDFADNETAVKDAYMEYVGLHDGLGLRIGNFKTFNSLEQMTSSRFITFMERSGFVNAFELDDRRIGGGAIYAQDHFTVAAGIYGPTAGDDSEYLKDVNNGAARVTVAPFNSYGHVMHLGASWRYRNGGEDERDGPPFDDQTFRYRERGADLHLADRFIATPQIFGQDTFWGLEAAAVWGPWSVQGEYGQLKSDIAPGFAGADPTYDGWYVEGSWFLTGESRVYKKGKFVRPKVKRPVNEGGRGAWQLAAKYDVINLSDKATTIEDCTMCGDQSTWLLGLNWWLNNHTRVTFNYNESKITGGYLNGMNENDGAKIKGFGARAQVDW